jgi:hypothetical protein
VTNTENFWSTSSTQGQRMRRSIIHFVSLCSPRTPHTHSSQQTCRRPSAFQALRLGRVWRAVSRIRSRADKHIVRRPHARGGANSFLWISQLLPRFTFRIPACERGLEALCNYHSVRTTSTGLAVDEPVHGWASHCADSVRVIAEAERLSSAGSTANVRRRPVTVRTGFRGDVRDDRRPTSSIGSSEIQDHLFA